MLVYVGENGYIRFLSKVRLSHLVKTLSSTIAEFESVKIFSWEYKRVLCSRCCPTARQMLVFFYSLLRLVFVQFVSLPKWMQLVHFVPAVLCHHASPSRGARVATILGNCQRQRRKENQREKRVLKQLNIVRV